VKDSSAVEQFLVFDDDSRRLTDHEVLRLTHKQRPLVSYCTGCSTGNRTIYHPTSDTGAVLEAIEVHLRGSIQ
jgi:hypothetical protein